MAEEQPLPEQALLVTGGDKAPTGAGQAQLGPHAELNSGEMELYVTL